MIGYYPINPANTADNEDAFGPRFFRTHFYDRMKAVCEVDGTTPVLELLLTSGQVLDVSNILELKPEYMLVSVFRDNRTCDDTYNTYIRYVTIFRINVLSQPHETRPIGFSMGNHPALLDAHEEPAAPRRKPRRK